MAVNDLKMMGTGAMESDDMSSASIKPERLKKVDAPVEAAIGAVNAAITAGALALAGSAAVTALGNQGSEKLGKLMMKNIKTTHYLPIVAVTAGFAVLGAVVRNSRARKHNEWADRQMEVQSQSHVERVQASADAPAAAPAR